MPHILPKKPDTATDFSWESFPPPPPEAENWKPDPDSVARPGDLPDQRFNRDSYEDSRAAAYKKEMGIYHVPADIAASLKSASPSPAVNGVTSARSGLGSWPTQIPRATRLPRHLVAEVSSPPPMSSVASRMKLTDLPNVAPITPSMSPTVRGAAPAKGKMEEHPIDPLSQHHPQTSNATNGSAMSAVPSWAAPLEKALAEDLQKAPIKSIPPHLRKTAKSTVNPSGQRLDPAAKSYEPHICYHDRTPRGVLTLSAAEAIVNEEDKNNDEALAWEMATTELGVDSPEQGLKLQEEMLSECTVKPPSQSVSPAPTTTSKRPHGNHGHWIKTRMVIIMEDDLDLAKRATRRELMAMSEDEINRYLQKVSSAHEQWWEAEQRLSFHETNGSE